MELMEISESVKVFLKNNRENIEKHYSEEQIRIALSILNEYGQYFSDNNFFLTPIEMIKSKEDVNEKVKEAKEQPKQESQDKEQPSQKEEDEDIDTLFEN